MLSKLMRVALLSALLAACGDKKSEPPKAVPSQPSPDPAPAARKADDPKPVLPDSGSKNADKAAPTSDTAVKERTLPTPQAGEFPMKAMEDKLKARKARAAKAQPPTPPAP